MKLKEFLNNLNKLVKENPKVLEYEVVYAEDEEGNRYNTVDLEPSIGNFEDDEFKICDYEDDGETELQLDDKDINAICIN